MSSLSEAVPAPKPAPPELHDATADAEPGARAECRRDGGLLHDARARLAASFRHVGDRETVRNTAWLIVGYAARLVLQLAAFVLVARIIGPAGFGAFAGALAMATLLSPFVELGAYTLIVRDVADGQPVPRAVGNSLLVGAVTVPLGLAVLAAAKPFALPMVPWRVVLCLGVAELVGTRLVQIASAANTATGTMRRTAVLELFSGALRMTAVCALLVLPGDAPTWATLYMLHALCVGATALWWTTRTWGAPTADASESRARARPGAHFAMGLAAQTLYTDLDKAMLPRLSTLEATGLYGAAARLVGVTHLPLNALLSAIYPRFFVAGRQGPREARRLAWKVLPVTASYGVLATAGLYVMAPFVTVALGAHYEESAAAVRLLAFIPLVQALWYPFADAMAGSGLQARRTRGQALAVVVNAGLNLALIPALGWRGAVWATLASQLLLLVYFLANGGDRA